jgi:L-2,4-diaminobutyric acid acetyltransferase
MDSATSPTERAAPRPGRAGAVTLRNPTREDAAAVWELVGASGALEPNTCYAYLLLCTHFAETCLVAEGAREKGLLGFVAAYRPPSDGDAVFVWQIGVAAEARGRGLASRLLDALVALPACADARFLEATVGESNSASERLFRAFARRHGVACRVTPGFRAEHFGPLDHEDEPLYRIGPLTSDA